MIAARHLHLVAPPPPEPEGGDPLDGPWPDLAEALLWLVVGLIPWAGWLVAGDWSPQELSVALPIAALGAAQLVAALRCLRSDKNLR